MFETELSRSTFLKGSLAVAAAAVLAGCSNGATEGASSQTKVLRFGVKNPKTSFDQQTNSSSQGVTEAVCESLVELNPETLELEPVLIEDMPEISEDGLSYKFTLKSGVKFHNGATLSAEDVKYTFTRMFLPETKSTSTDSFDYIVGAKEVMSGKTTELEGIVVDDDTHFTITLVKPYSAFLNMLAQFYGSIYPREALKEAGANWGTDLNFYGTGPYQLVSNDGTSEVVLKRFDDYHAGKPGLDELRFVYVDDPNTRMLNYKNDDIDLAFLDISLLPQYSDDADVKDQIHYYTPASTQFVNLNQQRNPALADVRVRQALSLAIDRQTICDTILSGAAKPCSGFVPPSEKGHDSDAAVLEYNVDKAKTLLSEAGYPNLSLTAKVRSSDQKLMVAIQNAWKQIGVDCSVEVIDAGVWSDARTNGELEVTIVTWSTLSFVAIEHMASYFRSDRAAKKSSFYNSAAFDKLVDDARTSLDADKALELTLEADKQMVQKDYACLPVDWPQMPYALKPQFKGLEVLVNPHFKKVTVSA